MRSRFVYGPVPSRRLGRSLGVDLVPFKTCSYDCIYCQLGRTTNRTTDLQEYVPIDAVIGELAEKLRAEPRPDFIGLAGSGEPTLYARLGELVAGIKARSSIPVAVLTNASLLWRPEVRAGLAEADLVMPSLDAGSEASFARVNRPHPDISFERMVEGLLTFSRGYQGKIWLEVFVLAGMTDGPDEIGRIAAIAERMRPERVQLNTVARPAADACALPAPPATLQKLCGLFAPPCEVIAESPAKPAAGTGKHSDVDDRIEALLGRRPSTLEGIAAALGLAPNLVLKHLEALATTGAIRTERRGDGVFYTHARSR